jgi:hypothetical protein
MGTAAAVGPAGAVGAAGVGGVAIVGRAGAAAVGGADGAVFRAGGGLPSGTTSLGDVGHGTGSLLSCAHATRAATR